MADKAMEQVLQILELVNHSHFRSMNLQVGDLLIQVSKDGTLDSSTVEDFTLTSVRAATMRTVQVAENLQDETRQPVPVAQASTSTSAKVEQDQESSVVLRAPMVGVFYRSPGPNEVPFAREGDVLEPDDTVCLIEVMKLFNSVPAGVPGVLQKFLVEDGASVEYNQPIAIILPQEDHGREGG